MSLNPRPILIANVICQAGIIFTGAVVRLSGSGLGCPTWPECVPGSFIPTAHQAQGWHKFIEYGNRTLTGVLMVVAVLTVLAVYRHTQDEKLRRLSWLPVAGTFAQALLGGVTVLTNLHSATVMAHFLLSVLLVAGSVLLWFRFAYPNAQPAEPLLRRIGVFALLSGGLLLTLGSLVSNTGPHSGDAEVPSAIALDPRVTAWAHADAMWFFFGSLLAGWVLLGLGRLSPGAKRMLHGITGITVLQGILGYTQFYTGLPVLVVMVHVLLAATFWCYTVGYALHLRWKVS